MGEIPDNCVFVGGPTNSLVIHGTGEGRGFRTERKVVVVRKEVLTGEQEWDVRYHMTDPRRISMSERRGQTVGLIRNIQECLPESQVCYVSMFPRHVTSCCMEHMTDDDVWVVDGIRRDVDKDIVEMLKDRNRTVTKVDWWEMLGTERDMTVRETKEMKIVDRDGVNLNNRANRCAAISLCHRILRTSGNWRMDPSF
jgi:hypothetical protein